MNRPRDVERSGTLATAGCPWLALDLLGARVDQAWFFSLLLCPSRFAECGKLFINQRVGNTMMFPNPESNPRPHGGSNGGLGGRVIVGGGVGEPPNRQGAALFNQGIDLLNHGIPNKASFRGKLKLACNRRQ